MSVDWCLKYQKISWHPMGQFENDRIFFSKPLAKGTLRNLIKPCSEYCACWLSIATPFHVVVYTIACLISIVNVFVCQFIFTRNLATDTQVWYSNLTQSNLFKISNYSLKLDSLAHKVFITQLRWYHGLNFRTVMKLTPQRLSGGPLYNVISRQPFS